MFRSVFQQFPSLLAFYFLAFGKVVSENGIFLAEDQLTAENQVSFTPQITDPRNYRGEEAPEGPSGGEKYEEGKSGYPKNKARSSNFTAAKRLVQDNCHSENEKSGCKNSTDNYDSEIQTGIYNSDQLKLLSETISVDAPFIAVTPSRVLRKRMSHNSLHKRPMKNESSKGKNKRINYKPRMFQLVNPKTALNSQSIMVHVLPPDPNYSANVVHPQRQAASNNAKEISSYVGYSFPSSPIYRNIMNKDGQLVQQFVAAQPVSHHSLHQQLPQHLPKTKHSHQGTVYQMIDTPQHRQKTNNNVQFFKLSNPKTQPIHNYNDVRPLTDKKGTKNIVNKIQSTPKSSYSKISSTPNVYESPQKSDIHSSRKQGNKKDKHIQDTHNHHGNDNDRVPYNENQGDNYDHKKTNYDDSNNDNGYDVQPDDESEEEGSEARKPSNQTPSRHNHYQDEENHPNTSSESNEYEDEHQIHPDVRHKSSNSDNHHHKHNSDNSRNDDESYANNDRRNKKYNDDDHHNNNHNHYHDDQNRSTEDDSSNEPNTKDNRFNSKDKYSKQFQESSELHDEDGNNEKEDSREGHFYEKPIAEKDSHHETVIPHRKQHNKNGRKSKNTQEHHASYLNNVHQNLNSAEKDKPGHNNKYKSNIKVVDIQNAQRDKHNNYHGNLHNNRNNHQNHDNSYNSQVQYPSAAQDPRHVLSTIHHKPIHQSTNVINPAPQLYQLAGVIGNNVPHPNGNYNHNYLHVPNSFITYTVAPSTSNQEQPNVGQFGNTHNKIPSHVLLKQSNIPLTFNTSPHKTTPFINYQEKKHPLPAYGHEQNRINHNSSPQKQGRNNFSNSPSPKNKDETYFKKSTTIKEHRPLSHVVDPDSREDDRQHQHENDKRYDEEATSAEDDNPPPNQENDESINKESSVNEDDSHRPGNDAGDTDDASSTEEESPHHHNQENQANYDDNHSSDEEIPHKQATEGRYRDEPSSNEEDNHPIKENDERYNEEQSSNEEGNPRHQDDDGRIRQEASQNNEERPNESEENRGNDEEVGSASGEEDVPEENRENEEGASASNEEENPEQRQEHDGRYNEQQTSEEIDNAPRGSHKNDERYKENSASNEEPFMEQLKQAPTYKEKTESNENLSQKDKKDLFEKHFEREFATIPSSFVEGKYRTNHFVPSINYPPSNMLQNQYKKKPDEKRNKHSTEYYSENRRSLTIDDKNRTKNNDPVTDIISNLPLKEHDAVNDNYALFSSIGLDSNNRKELQPGINYANKQLPKDKALQTDPSSFPNSQTTFSKVSKVKIPLFESFGNFFSKPAETLL